MQRIYPAQFGNEPLNWQGMPPTAGQAPTTPTIDTQPVDLTVAVGANATFAVSASGAPPLAYQWQFFNGAAWVNLTDNARINGSHSSALTIAPVYPSDAGSYQVVITNGLGSASSSAISARSRLRASASVQWDQSCRR